MAAFERVLKKMTKQGWQQSGEGLCPALGVSGMPVALVGGASREGVSEALSGPLADSRG